MTRIQQLEAFIGFSLMACGVSALFLYFNMDLSEVPAFAACRPIGVVSFLAGVILCVLGLKNSGDPSREPREGRPDS